MLVFGKINFEKILSLVLVLAATEVSRPQEPPLSPQPAPHKKYTKSTKKNTKNTKKTQKYAIKQKYIELPLRSQEPPLAPQPAPQKKSTKTHKNPHKKSEIKLKIHKFTITKNFAITHKFTKIPQSCKTQ